MGNNAAFTNFEATVIAVYDKGVLDKSLLGSLMEQHRGIDIDRGGMEGTLSKDGLDVEEITIQVGGGVLPKRPDLPEKMSEWTEGQHQANEDYWEQRFDEFNKITDQHGWH